MPKSRWLVGATVVVGLLGLLIRIYILGTTSGQLNADEAFTGLQALEIAGGDLPIVYRGIGYTGIIDSYVFAPFVKMFGAHVVPLKLLTSLWWITSSLVLYRVVRSILQRIGNVQANRWAFLGGSMLWLTPGAMMVVSTRAWEAYGLLLLTILAAAMMLWRVVISKAQSARQVFVAGALLGAAFYLHPMTLAAILPMAAVPSWIFRRKLRGWWLPALGGAILVNVPFFAWNIKNDWLSLAQPSPPINSVWDRFSSFFTGLIPRALGVMDVDGGWTWGPISVGLYGVLMYLIVRGLWTLGRRVEGGLVFVAPAIFCWPILSLFNNMWFVEDGRYSSVGFPFLILAMVIGLADVASHRSAVWSQRRVFVGLAVVWVSLLVIPWVKINAGPRLDDPNVQARVLVSTIEEAGFEYAAGNYWLMNPIEYQSNQRIRVAVAGHPWGAIFEWRPKLPWGVSFAQRQVEVLGQSPLDVAYVFLAGDEQIEALPLGVEQYDRRELVGAVLYLPIAPE